MACGDEQGPADLELGVKCTAYGREPHTDTLWGLSSVAAVCMRILCVCEECSVWPHAGHGGLLPFLQGKRHKNRENHRFPAGQIRE